MFFYILKTPFGDNNDKEVVDFLFVPHSFIWSVVSSSTAICPPCLLSTFIPSRFCVSGWLDWWKSILLVVYFEISEVFLAFFLTILIFFVQEKLKNQRYYDNCKFAASNWKRHSRFIFI